MSSFPYLVIFPLNSVCVVIQRRMLKHLCLQAHVVVQVSYLSGFVAVKYWKVCGVYVGTCYPDLGDVEAEVCETLRSPSCLE